MRVVYIAAPFRAETPWQQEQNVRRAEEAALELWKKGYACICPHAMTRFYQGECPDKVWLDGTLEIMKRCDLVYCLSGWEKSHGASVEWEKAGEWNIPVLYSIDEMDI